MSEDYQNPEDQNEESPQTEKIEPVRVSLKKKRKQVTVELDNDEEVTFEVVELTGAERDSYLNYVEARVGIVNGQRKVRDYKGIVTELLCRSVYDADGRLVKRPMVENWPSSMQTVLADISRELSGLEDDEEDADEGNGG